MGSVVILHNKPRAVAVSRLRVLRKYIEEIKIDEAVSGGKICLCATWQLCRARFILWLKRASHFEVFSTLHSSCKISDRQLLPCLSFRKHDWSSNQKSLWCVPLWKGLMASSVTVKYLLADLWNALLGCRLIIVYIACSGTAEGFLLDMWGNDPSLRKELETVVFRVSHVSTQM